MRRLAELDLAAASGLVVRGDELLVAADDEHCVARYDRDGAPRGRIALPGEPLPDAYAPRKKRKPDYEALALLPDGALLALGSGSRRRRRGWAWIDARLEAVRVVDAAGLYEALAQRLGKLNVEGAVVRGDELVLGQRGAGDVGSALAFLDLSTVRRELALGTLTDASLRRTAPLDLGALAGIPLRLTDLALGADGGLHFSAAAEDTRDAYEDAPCAGSRIGRLDAALAVDWLLDVPAPLKIEGLAWDAAGARWLMVADADDRASRAPLLAFQ